MTQVVVHVTNNMQSDGTTIHFHGMYQQRTPWMDGTAYVTQCLIPPRQSFTHRFKAKPSGTHWYHSHISDQRTDGLFGLMIVHAKKPQVGEHEIYLSYLNFIIIFVTHGSLYSSRSGLVLVKYHGQNNAAVQYFRGGAGPQETP